MSARSVSKRCVVRAGAALPTCWSHMLPLPLQGTPVLTIGPHILEGKVEKLPAPLVVLRRDDGSIVAASGDAQAEGLTYTVAGIASQKLLFKSRPKLSLGTR